MMCPTPEDMRRDLDADLKLCESASPEPWLRNPGYPFIYSCPADKIIAMIPGTGDPEGEQAVANDAFLRAARTGWPAALRRAQAAEAQLAAAQVALRALKQSVQALGATVDSLLLGRENAGS